MHLALSWPNISKVEARHRKIHCYQPATLPRFIPSYSSYVLRAVLAVVMMKPTPTLSRSLVRVAARPQCLQSIQRSQLVTRISRPSAVTRSLRTTRQFSQSTCSSKGLSPGSSDPPPPKTESSELDSHTAPVDLTDGHYHEIADDYLNNLLLALEEKAEISTEFEVEYSAGVLTLTTPKGTYVMNKQPPNRQIWLSSPISGPKRFDWVTANSTASQYEKQETEDSDDGGDDGKGGRWMYLRDKTTLTELLEKEVDVRVKGGDGKEGFQVT